jgi:cell division protein FtsI/penicillin-binding protein 2
VAGTLRVLMRQVVTQGTAAPAGLPGKVGGKTGTAEFGTGDPLPTHAWFIGFRGDLAFAVVVEDGGVGGRVAAPVAARFLNGL